MQLALCRTVLKTRCIQQIFNICFVSEDEQKSCGLSILVGSCELLISTFKKHDSNDEELNDHHCCCPSSQMSRVERMPGGSHGSIIGAVVGLSGVRETSRISKHFSSIM